MVESEAQELSEDDMLGAVMFGHAASVKVIEAIIKLAELAAKEDLDRVRPDLDGNAIMQLLDIPPGPQVGEAWNFLKELRLDRGPLSADEAEAELLAWWNDRRATAVE